MKHYGDITKLNGAELPVVDIITGGSPCQDLSVAGKRAGLAGERSGLFMEQIRIIKEMRENDRQRAIAGADDDIRLVRPRYLVWENVPGALSSPGGDKKGQDFRCVLEEICRVADKTAVIPGPPKGGWPPSGCIMGSGEYGIYSVAWRVHDAQFWGVPQRRKRIALVADFGGQTAPEILFERKGVSRDFEESGETGETAAGDVAKSIGETGKLDEWCAAVNGEAKHQQDLIQHDQGIARTLAPGTHASGSHLTKTLVTGGAYTLKIRGGTDTYIKSDGSIGTAGKGPLVQTELSGTLGVSQDQTLICLNDQGGQQMDVSEDVSGTLRAEEHGHQPIVFEPGAASRVGGHVYDDDVAGTVRANAGDNQQAVVYGISSYDSNAMKSSNPNSGIYEAETARTLDLNGGSPACNQGGMAVVCATTEMTPKTDEDGVSFSLRSRDYKDPQVVCIEGNGSRPSHQGDGWHEGDPMYTLNSTEHHAVAYRKQGHPQNAEQGQGWEPTEVNDTLNAFDSGEMRTPTVVLENHPADSRVKISEGGIVQTLSSRMGTGGGNVPMVMEGINGETAGTLDASYYKGCGERQGIEREVVCVGNGQLAQARLSDKVGALNCMHDQQAVMTYQDRT